jgi:hypothetical protein
MHTTTVSPVPRSIEVPRGARWAASAFLALVAAWRRSQAVARTAGEHRRRIVEAAGARSIANDFARRGDTAVANEIHAAANRHDRGL